MAISDNYVPIRQIGNGVTTAFSSNWNMIASAYALVYLEDTTTGVQTAVPPGPGAGQYTLVFSASGFTVTFGTAPTASQYAVIGRSVALDQTDPYRTSKGYQGEVLESSLDKLTAMAQDQGDETARSLKFPLGSTAIGALPVPVNGASLIWSGTGGTITNGPNSADIANAANYATVAAAAASSAAASASSINAARNSIINGGFDIWQRNTAYALTTGNVYGSADRWAFSMATSAAGIANRDQTAVPPGYRYNLKLGRNNGSALTGNIDAIQALETLNSIPLAGQSAVLSFYAKAGANFSAASSLIFVQLYSGTGTDQSPTGIGSWTGVSLPVNQFQIITGGLVRYSFLATIPSNCKQLGVRIGYTPSGTAGADDNLYLGGVRLDLGGAAGISQAPAFGEELSRCQRYYQKSFPYGTVPAQNGGTTNCIVLTQAVGASTAMYSNAYSLKETMRTGPTLTLYNPSAANAQARNFITATDCASTVNNNTSTDQFEISFTTPGGSAAGNQIGIHYSLDAEL